MNNELKPCPFCGSDIEIICAYHKYAHKRPTDDTECVAHILCPNCGFLIHIKQKYGNVIQNWNERATDILADSGLKKIRPILREIKNAANRIQFVLAQPTEGLL